jgi:hypothetical protein
VKFATIGDWLLRAADLAPTEELVITDRGSLTYPQMQEALDAQFPTMEFVASQHGGACRVIRTTWRAAKYAKPSVA